MQPATVENAISVLREAIRGDAGHEDYLARHLNRLRFLGGIIAEIPNPGSALDTGASPGHVSAVAKSLGWDVTAADLFPEKQFPTVKGGERINLFQKLSIPVAELDICEQAFPFPDKEFGLALFNETLEHLCGSPLPPLKEIARVLAPGGRLILTTPNVASLSNRLRLLAGRNVHTHLEAYLNLAPYKRHNREYTLGEVLRLIEKAGLRTVRAGLHNIGEPAGDVARTMLRPFYYALTSVWPGARSLICVIAEKPS